MLTDVAFKCPDGGLQRMAKGIAYFDCFSGASGDMLLGALLDAGLELSELEAALAGLSISDYKLSLEQQLRRGISGSKFNVLDQGHGRPARNLGVVRELLESSELGPKVVARSLCVFERLAEAEARVHGTTVDQVHFHELGAVDTLVDIVGFCWGIQRLRIDAIYASALPLGSGTIMTEHGLLPVPAPATLALLAEAKVPTVPSKARDELVTPTGAALLTTLATFSRPAMAVHRVGYGFGSKEFPWPNAVRVWIGEECHFSAGPSPHPLHGHRHPEGLAPGHHGACAHRPSAGTGHTHHTNGVPDSGERDAHGHHRRAREV